MTDDEEDDHRTRRRFLRRNLVAFWILGLCNNFAYVVMLSAARDILGETAGGDAKNGSDDDSGKCIDSLDKITCSKISTSAILLADIIPSLVVKLLCPFLLNSISYSVRHAFVLLFQVSSFLLVALSERFYVSIIGVVFASTGSGLGEVSYLSLTSHFPREVISTWSSGTGGAGIVGSLAFAVMTDHRFFDVSPRTALLLMLVLPLVLFYTFWRILVFPATVHRVNFWRISTYIMPDRRVNAVVDVDDTTPFMASDNANSPLLGGGDSPTNNYSSNTPRAASSSLVRDVALLIEGTSLKERIKTYISSRFSIIKPLVKYMIPLCIVYYAEYFINQGLLELLIFTCSKGFELSPASQYRWYQVLYQMGVFISRSSIRFIELHPFILPILSLLQVFNAILLFNRAMYSASGHIIFIFLIVFYEGLLGGAAYVNTFNTLHKTIQFHREFSLSFVSMSDTLGIVIAGFTGIWAHNYICSRSKAFFHSP